MQTNNGLAWYTISSLLPNTALGQLHQRLLGIKCPGKCRVLFSNKQIWLPQSHTWLLTALDQRKGPWDELKQRDNDLVSKQAGMKWRTQQGAKVMEEARHKNTVKLHPWKWLFTSLGLLLIFCHRTPPALFIILSRLPSSDLPAQSVTSPLLQVWGSIWYDSFHCLGEGETSGKSMHGF